MKSILPLKKRLVLLASVLLGYSAQAQVATTYNFSQSVGTYTAISGGTVLANATMGNLDEDYFMVPISSFKFDGISYTAVYVSTNGYISFGESMDTYEYDPISGFYTYAGAVAGFGADLDDSGSGAGARNIRAEQVGNELVIQWQNVRRYDVTGERLSFQIRLNTVTNEINIVYGGTITPGDNQVYPEIGLRGPDNDFATNVNNREILAGTGAWVNSAPGTSEFSTCYFDSNTPATIPAAGTTFKWTPAPDIEIQNFVFTAANECYGSAETVSATIQNTGGSTVDFSVTPLTINASVSGTNPMTFTPVTINTGTLAPGAVQTIQITASYDMSSGGSSYVFNASISMTGDAYPSNNTLNKTRFNYSPAIDYSDVTNCSGLGVTLTGTSNSFIYNSVTENNTPLAIPDEDIIGATSTIVVSNAGSATASSVIATIENLTHTYTSDLTITLIAPDGSSADLFFEGGSDADIFNAVFSDTAANAISSGDNPFTGSFQPETPFSGLTGPANGTWQLVIVDNYGFDVGTLNSWSVSFPGTNSITSYAWTPATDLSSSTVANPTASPSSTASYTITVTDERGCTATDDVTVNISSLPTVTASSDAAGDIICEGESVTLTGSGTATSFTWNNSVTDGVAFEPASTATYIVTGTDASNCSNTDTITIVVNNAPTVTASSDAAGNTICEGESVTLTGGGTATSYSWDNSVIDNDAFEPASTNTYTVTGTDANGCENTATITVTVNPAPIVSLSLTVDELCVYHNSVTLAGGTPAGGTYSGTGVTGGSFNPATAGTGTFAITYAFTDANGCSASSSDNMLVDACLGLDETAKGSLEIAPNPSNGLFIISGSANLEGIVVLDAQGKTVPFEWNGQTDLTIDLRQAENGVYFLTGTIDGTPVMSRLVKQ